MSCLFSHKISTQKKHAQSYKIIKQLSSFIQTILSALEFHQINSFEVAGYTAGRELHPALKRYSIIYTLSYTIYFLLSRINFLSCHFSGLKKSILIVYQLRTFLHKIPCLHRLLAKDSILIN